MWRTTNQCNFGIVENRQNCACKCHFKSDAIDANPIEFNKKDSFFEKMMMDHYFNSTTQMDIFRKKTTAMLYPFEVSSQVKWVLISISEVEFEYFFSRRTDSSHANLQLLCVQQTPFVATVDTFIRSVIGQAISHFFESIFCPVEICRPLSHHRRTRRLFAYRPLVYYIRN